MKKMHMVKYFFLILAFLNLEDSTAQVVGTPYMPTSILPPNSPPIVSSPITGRLWMAYNLDATQVATSSTDALSFGGLFQWGRQLDGHQKWTPIAIRSTNTSTKLTVFNEMSSNFITSGSVSGDFYRHFPFRDVNFQISNTIPTIWQPKTGINNPCPSGFRIPTENEFKLDLPVSINTIEKAFQHFLKIPNVNRFRSNDGSVILMNGNVHFCYFWTSTLKWATLGGNGGGGTGYFPMVMPVSLTGDGEISDFNKTLPFITNMPIQGSSIRCIKGLGGEN